MNIQNRDYLNKLRIAAAGRIKERDYWVSRLEGEMIRCGFPEMLPEVSDVAPSDDEIQWDQQEIVFPSELIDGLSQISKGSLHALYFILAAGVSFLLSKYSGLKDVLLTAPIYEQKGTADFINTALLLHSCPEEETSVKELLLQMRQTIVDATQHYAYPIELLPELMESAAGTDEKGKPVSDRLWDVAILVEGLHKESYIQHLEHSIIFRFSNHENALKGVVSYKSQRYARHYITQISNHLISLLLQVTANPNMLLKDIDLLTDEEKHRILEKLNDTTSDYPMEKTIAQVFEEQVQMVPDQVALYHINRSYLTYRQLDAAARNLASILTAKGVGPGDIVAMMVKRSLDMYVAIFGVQISGAAYLPIEPGTPVNRVTTMLRDCLPRFILTQADVMADYDFSTLETIVLDSMNFSSPLLSSPSLPQTERKASASDPAYIIYTSGSTGEPKGTVVTNGNVINMVKSPNALLANPQDRMIQLSSYVFDGSIFDIFSALLNGASMVVINPDTIQNLDVLASVIRDSRITIFIITTALFNALVDLNTDALDYVRNMGFGAERVSFVHICKAFERIGPGKMVHLYGPTEATVYATEYPVKTIHPKAETIPIGKPIGNAAVYILDKHLRPVPLGVAGEICIGGDGVSPGYLNRPELTHRFFVPFTPSEDSKPEGKDEIRKTQQIYKTGDLGRLLLDGNIEFVGRVDQQVKIRGYRIELGEIEGQLMRLPEIEKAVVTVGKNPSGDAFLCGYIVPVTVGGVKKDVDINQIKEALSLHLMEYMIPRYMMVLEELPLTLNGKVDLRALPDLPIHSGNRFCEPVTEVEKQLALIWAEILGIEAEKISVEDSFFEIGGHSIKATVMIAKAQEAFNVKIPMAQLFRTPTIRELAKHIPLAQDDRFFSIPVIETREYYDLSHAQKRIWTACQIQEASISNNIPMVQMIPGELRPDVLGQALDILVERHESLRTVFITVHDEPKQKILPLSQFPAKVELFDYQAQYGTINDQALRQWVEKHALEPFDLQQGPLFKVIVVKLPEGHHLLFFNIHHIISDFISNEVLMREITGLYRSMDQHLPHGLTPLRIQYKDYAYWHNGQLQGEEALLQFDYWQKQLETPLPMLKLPWDFERPAMQTFDGQEVGDCLEGEAFAALKQVCESEKATLFMGLITALNVLFYHYSGQEDIILGTVIAGREHVDLQDQIGYFLNTLPLRTRFERTNTFQQLLSQVKEMMTDAFQNQSYPFDKLVDKLEIPRKINRSPVFDIIVDMLNDQSIQSEGDESIESYTQKDSGFEFNFQMVKFDISIILVERPDHLVIKFQYNRRLFSHQTIERMVQRFLTILKSMPKELNTPVSGLKLEKKTKAPAIQVMAR